MEGAVDFGIPIDVCPICGVYEKYLSKVIALIDHDGIDIPFEYWHCMECGSIFGIEEV